MTKLLLRLFVKNADATDSPQVRSAMGKLSGIVGIVCNLLLFGFKLLVGTLSGSVAIAADAMNNLSDAASAIVTLIGFKLAERPADEHHPYGHARYEYLSGLAVAGMILVIGFELAKTSVEKIFNPSPTEFTVPVAAVLIGSIAVKLWLSVFNNTLGKRIDSQTLYATAADSRNDCIATGAVLLAGVVEYFTKWRVDGYMGLAVGVFILISGMKLARETISPLLGEAASPELRKLITTLLEDNSKVLGYHDLMVHDYGPGQRFASVHVEMDRREDALLCHEIIDDMERRCLADHNIHLVIHYDPVVTDDPEQERLRLQVTELLREVDERLHIHDFRMVPGSGHTNLVFDVSRPAELADREKTLCRMLEQTLSEREGKRIYTVITFDAAEFN